MASATDTTLERRGYAFMIAASLGFAVMGVCGKLATTHLPAHEVAFFRAFGGVFVTVTGVLALRTPWPSQPALLILRGVMGWASLMLTFLAYAGLHLADAVFLVQTSPFFTALMAAALLGEKLSSRTWACLAGATVGVACVVGPQGGFWNWYALAALGAACFASLAYMAVKRANVSSSPWLIACSFSVVSSLLSGPFLLARYQPPTSHEWQLLTATALAGTAAQLLMTYAYRYARASTVSIFSLLTPLFSAVLGTVVFGIMPGWGTFAGGLLILGSGAWLFTAPAPPADAAVEPASTAGSTARG